MFPWGKLGKGYMGSLCIISYKCMSIHNYLKINSLIKKKKAVLIMGGGVSPKFVES